VSKPKITREDLCRNAKRLGTSTAEVQAFLEVETKNRGFDDHDRPIILFERHWFHKLTGGRFDATHPHISNPEPGGYGHSSEQYQRFSEAFALDPQAAMKSASWGLGQVMGFNYAICGYPSVDAFVDAMKESEGKQLDASVSFIIHSDLDDELRRHDWAGFARGYNGKNYKINQYDAKLALAYSGFSHRKLDCSDSAKPAEDPASDPQMNVDKGEGLDGVEPQTSALSVPDPAPPMPPSEVKVTEVTDTKKTEITTTVGTPPTDPAVQVSQNGGLARMLTGGGTATAIGGAVVSYLTGHLDGVAVMVICVTVLILALIFRGTITDAIRMQTHADPNRYNVK
jgi:hypothetical protein